MDWRSIGIVSDPGGVLIGLWRRAFGDAVGELPKTDASRSMMKKCLEFRYIEWELKKLRADNPDRPEPLLIEGRNARDDKDWAKLLEVGQILQRQFPALFEGYANVGLALRGLRRLDQAEALALSVQHRFPRNPAGFESYAACAEARGDLVAAEQRWNEARRRFPGTLWPWIRCCNLLMRLGRLDEAEVLASAVVAAFPDKVLAWTLFTEVAEVAGNWDAMATRCDEGMERYEGIPEFYARGARAARLKGDIVAASALIAKATFMFPRDKATLEEREHVIKAGGDPGPMPDLR